MNNYKYIVYPSYVPSKNDDERHYISFHKLCELYKVDPKDCLNACDDISIKGIRRDIFDTLIPLHVSYSGNYTIKNKNE